MERKRVGFVQKVNINLNRVVQRNAQTVPGAHLLVMMERWQPNILPVTNVPKVNLVALTKGPRFVQLVRQVVFKIKMPAQIV
tara:strand:- start:415 stop:660 length:246 start_codon:yes stop_codon:yes gene_type:complete